MFYFGLFPGVCSLNLAKPSYSMRMDGRTEGKMEGHTDGHMMKLIVSFSNFAAGPNKRKICIIVLNLVINAVVTAGI
jgi:hypothetical protein